MRIQPLDATLGATVEEVALTDLGPGDWEAIEAAFHDYGVLVFPGQHLDDKQQKQFSRRFGRLERGISARSKVQDIARLSNQTRDGGVAADGSALHLFLKGNQYWHADSSFKVVGAKCSLLSARVVPSAGGETEFADMRAAWKALDEEMRAFLLEKNAEHHYWYSQSKVGGTELLAQEDWDALPPVQHPIVRTHPATGRKNLYIGRHVSHVVGMEKEVGRALIEKLIDDACQPPRTFSHRWQVGDLVAWDNRCVLHRGHSWPVDEPRTMHRTTVAGDGDNPWALPN